MNTFLKMSWLQIIYYYFFCFLHFLSFLLYSSSPESSVWTNIALAYFYMYKYSNSRKLCTARIRAYMRLSIFSFFQVIRVKGKYMHRQTRSYQGDLIQWVQDISLIGLSSISHARKVSVSSYHTLLLWNHFLSWRERAPQGKKMHLIRQGNLIRYQIITLVKSFQLGKIYYSDRQILLKQICLDEYGSCDRKVAGAKFFYSLSSSTTQLSGSEETENHCQTKWIKTSSVIN